MTNKPVVIVELILPYCENTFGNSPCTATADAGKKCFNCYANCLDKDNFTLGEKSYYFTHGDTEKAAIDILAATDGVTPHVTPSLTSYSSLATKINIAGATSDFSGLGTRSKLTLQFKDHASNDLFTDPYVDERLYDPKSQGTFWTKFFVRNRYRKNKVINVYEGQVGDTLDDMTKRTFFWYSDSWPTEGGSVSIVAKDVLAFLEDKELQVPALSSGELYADIDDSVTSFRVTGASASNYDASGTVRIDDEIMTYTSITDGTDYITFNGVTRATDNTEADEHSEETTVQRCVRIDDVTVESAVETLCSESYEGNIPDEYLDTTQWATETGANIPGYRVSELLSEPTSVVDLIGQISEQTMTYIYWEERERLVKLRAVVGYSSPPETITDTSNIMSGFQITQMPEERVTQLWYYYYQEDQSADDDDESGYKRAFIQYNSDKESDEEYGSSRIRKIKGNWIKDRFIAQDVAGRYMVRYVDIPRKASFSMDVKDQSYGVGDVIYINHWLDIDEYGDHQTSVWLITEQTPVVRDGKVSYVAHDLTAYGRLYYWMADDAADYVDEESRDFVSAYWGDDDGLLPDGTVGATWG